MLRVHVVPNAPGKMGDTKFSSRQERISAAFPKTTPGEELPPTPSSSGYACVSEYPELEGLEGLRHFMVCCSRVFAFATTQNRNKQDHAAPNQTVIVLFRDDELPVHFALLT